MHIWKPALEKYSESETFDFTQREREQTLGVQHTDFIREDNFKTDMFVLNNISSESKFSRDENDEQGLINEHWTKAQTVPSLSVTSENIIWARSYFFPQRFIDNVWSIFLHQYYNNITINYLFLRLLCKHCNCKCLTPFFFLYRLIKPLPMKYAAQTVTITQ